MEIKTHEEIRKAQARIWEGQHWTRTTAVGGNIWPDSLVITEREGFILGHVTTMVIVPRKRIGRTFPIRADVLVANYALTYDPVNHLGELESRLADYEVTLFAIMEQQHPDLEKLQGMARSILEGTSNWLPTKEEEDNSLEEVILATENQCTEG